MNRIKALFIADRIMTRIETDKAIHKDAIADEIQAAEVIDVISYDEAKKCWVFRDGTPIEPEANEYDKTATELLADSHGGHPHKFTTRSDELYQSWLRSQLMGRTA